MSNKDLNININAKNNVSSIIDDILKSLRLLTEQIYILQTKSNSPEIKNTSHQLTQELSQLQSQLLEIKKTGDAEMAKEIAKAKQEEIDLEEKNALDLVKVAETEAQQQLELGNINNTQFLEKQKAFEYQRYQIALKAVQDRRGLLDEHDTKGIAKNVAETKAITNKYAADTKATNHAMAKDSQASFNAAFSPIKSAFGSTIQGILQGTTTLKQGMKNAFQSIALSYTQSLANMALDTAAQWLWDLMGFEVKETRKGAIKATSEATQTGATVVGVTSRTTVEAAGAATSKAVEASTANSKITSKAASAAAGAYDAMVDIPYVGPIIAPIAAAVAFVGVMAFGGMVSSSKGGEWDVPEDRLNFVHKNETILPATIAQPMRDFFAAGNLQGLALPDQAGALNGNVGAGLATTAASALSAQQAMMQNQQQQQRQSQSGTVVINTKGGDFIHKNDLARMLVADKRNFKYAK